MDNTELTRKIGVITGEQDDDILLTYLSMAKGIVLNRLYPFEQDIDPETTEIPARYVGNVIEIAVYLINRRGTEGETRNVEGVITRDYEAGSVPASMLSQIIPFVKTIGG